MDAPEQNHIMEGMAHPVPSPGVSRENEHSSVVQPSVPSCMSVHNTDVNDEDMERTLIVLPKRWTEDEEAPDEMLVRGENAHEIDDQGLVSDSSQEVEENGNDFADVHEEEYIEPLQEDPTQATEGTNSIICEGPQQNEQRGENIKYPSPNLKLMRKRMKLMVKWEQMISCVSISGSVRLSEQQYKFMVRAMKTCYPKLDMRTYAAVKNKFWNGLLDFAAPSSSLLHLKDLHSITNPGNQVKTSNAGWKHVGDCVRIVMPSQWAKLDIITDAFYRTVFEKADSNHPDCISIENSPIIQHRKIFCGVELVLWSLYEDAVCPCEQNDRVTFNCSKAVCVAGENSYESNWPHVPVQGEPNVIISGKVGPLWCVIKKEEKDEVFGVLTEAEEEIMLLLKDQQYNSFEAVRQRHRQQRGLRDLTQGAVLELCIGDVCMFFRPSQQTNSQGNVHCLFVGSPVSHSYGGSVELLVWVKIRTDRVGNKFVKRLAQRSVRGLPKWIGGRRTLPLPRGKRMRNKGVLPCGSNYYVYRVALYADAFKKYKSMGNTNQVVGVYLLPLGLPSQQRRSADAARVITVVPHGQDVRTVFRKIEDDLIEAATEGVVGMDPYGNVARIFIDPVSFYGDYPAVTSMTDVRGHTATAFCTFCTMRRRTAAEGRTLLHLKQAHSRRLGYMRFDARTHAIRSSDPPSDLMQSLGFANDVDREMYTAEETPLVHYSRRVRDLKKESVRSAPVLSMEFDPCLNVAAAPDHLFTGMITDVFNACFLGMDSDTRRKDAEVEIVDSARKNGLPNEGFFLKWYKGKYVGMESLTMTTRLCLLFCSVPTFDREFQRTRESVFKLPTTLQKLISMAYYVPCGESQGPKARMLYTEHGKLRTHGMLNRTARDYIGLCDEIFKGNNLYGKELNKPNVHRALELCVLTIPSFGHARNCSEMVLESMHRTVKRWVEKNTHPDSHVTAVEQALLRDWLSRIHKLYNDWLSNSQEDYERAELGLRRLLLGEKSLGLDVNVKGVSTFLNDFRVGMANAFREPVLSEMGKCDHLGEKGSGLYSWELSGALQEGEEVSQGTSLEIGMEILAGWYQGNGFDDIELRAHTTAKFIVMNSSDGKRRSYQHNRLARGNAISIVTRPRGPEDVIIRGCAMDNEHGEVLYFAVFDIVLASNGDGWCVAKRLSRTGNGFSVAGNAMAVVLLGRRVRRVAIFHECDADCRVVARKGVFHSLSLLRGGVYKVYDRAGGYPPHVG